MLYIYYIILVVCTFVISRYGPRNHDKAIYLKSCTSDLWLIRASYRKKHLSKLEDLHEPQLSAKLSSSTVARSIGSLRRYHKGSIRYLSQLSLNGTITLTAILCHRQP